MLIRKATFVNLHGHFTRTLSFEPGVNIVIGINGSGKTAMLNAIAWTLSPQTIQSGILAAYSLSQMEFDKIVVSYSIPGKRSYTHVTATRTAREVSIEISGLEGRLDIPVVDGTDTYGPAFSRQRTDEVEWLSRYFERESDNPVFRHLVDLQGPLYLPLNRRWPEEVESERTTARGRRTATAGQLPISTVFDLTPKLVSLASRVRPLIQ